MGVEIFKDDEQGYSAWLAANPDGFVLNVHRSLTPANARLHSSRCRTIRGTPPRGTTWTGEYIKVCSPSRPDLDSWISRTVARPVPNCRVCAP